MVVVLCFPEVFQMIDLHAIYVFWPKALLTSEGQKFMPLDGFCKVGQSIVSLFQI